MITAVGLSITRVEFAGARELAQETLIMVVRLVPPELAPEAPKVVAPTVIVHQPTIIAENQIIAVNRFLPAK